MARHGGARCIPVPRVEIAAAIEIHLMVRMGRRRSAYSRPGKARTSRADRAGVLVAPPVTTKGAGWTESARAAAAQEAFTMGCDIGGAPA
jgi:hypothetical protein